MAGLPGSGKSHLAARLADELGVPVVSVDPIEAAMWRAGVGGPGDPLPTGLAAYVVAEAIAEENLRAGRSLIIDAVNAVEPARGQWRELATRTGVPLRFIETVCPDPETHHSRLAGRRRDIAGFVEPTWEDVVARYYAAWVDDHLTVDTTDDDAATLRRTLGYLQEP
ncbi:AAA family ATPase [Georgenia subflava]|nr:ATP-binding protein [Georgenia subflava]